MASKMLVFRPRNDTATHQEDTMTGTISHGTHRPEDLIPTFIDALSERLDAVSLKCPKGQELALSRRIGQVQERLGEIERRMDVPGYYETEDATWDLEDLFELLDEFAPEGTRFGAHEGDGTDFGFWPVEDAY